MTKGTVVLLILCAFMISLLHMSTAALSEITKTGCGTTKGCFSQPESGCENSKTCDYLLTYSKDNDKIVFELSSAKKWVAIGLNDKPKSMPGTDAVMCTTLNSGIAIQHYDLTVKKLPAKTDPLQSEIALDDSFSDGGRTLCRFSRKITGSGKLKNLDQKHYLVFAYGDVVADKPDYHSWRKWSGSAVALNSTFSVKSGEQDNSLLKAHGSLMTIAWMCFASIAILMARYMKPMWDGQTLLGKPVWFMVHRGLMTLVVLFSTIAIICIFVHRKEWSKGIGAHPYTGIIAFALAIANPIMALFRPHPGEPKRFIFNWAHRTVGLSAFCLAVVTLFLAVYLKQLKIENTGLPVMIVFCVGIAIIVVLDIILCYIRTHASKEQYSFPQGQDKVEQMEQEQPAVRPIENIIRFFMLAFWILVAVGTTIALVVTVVTMNDEH